jgi:hypothetical protein
MFAFLLWQSTIGMQLVQSLVTAISQTTDLLLD